MKRWDAMAKAFTRIGREIAMAAKTGGIDPDTNPSLRVAIQNAKGASMPKDRVEAAIKRASAKDEKDYEEVIYEGYGPYGIAILVETATDNPTRTVSNVRLYFNRNAGALGKTGSLDFLFDRKGVFRISAEGVDMEELELELIDFGAEDISHDEEENEIYIYTSFEDYGKMQKVLDERHLNIKSSELQRIPHNYVEVTTEQEAEIQKLLDRFEEDEDVSYVFHNMASKE